MDSKAKIYLPKQSDPLNIAMSTIGSQFPSDGLPRSEEELGMSTITPGNKLSVKKKFRNADNIGFQVKRNTDR
jgi:hypothetical protein